MHRIKYENYTKPSDFMSMKIGRNTIRIVSTGVMGYQHGMRTARGWVNLGLCSEKPDCDNCKKGYEPKAVWKWLVFDYDTNRVKLLDAGPMMGNQICEIASKEGDPQEYDLVITRVGEGLKTEYTVEKAKENKTIDTDIEFAKRRLISKYFKS